MNLDKESTDRVIIEIDNEPLCVCDSRATASLFVKKLLGSGWTDGELKITTVPGVDSISDVDSMVIAVLKNTSLGSCPHER